MADEEEVTQGYRTELELGGVEIRLIAYPWKLTDRSSVNALIAAQADVLIDFAANLASQTRPE